MELPLEVPPHLLTPRQEQTFRLPTRSHFGSSHFFSNPHCFSVLGRCLFVVGLHDKMPRRGWHVSEDLSRAVWQEILRGPRPPAARWPPAQGSRQRQRSKVVEDLQKVVAILFKVVVVPQEAGGRMARRTPDVQKDAVCFWTK